MDRLRQGIFSSLGQRVDGARICDLFAGTGSYGLEALSRGATSAAFVEQNRQACLMIKDNIRIVAKSMGVENLETIVQTGDAIKANGLVDQEFDLIFADPPYEIVESIHSTLFVTFDRLLAENGRVVFEMPGRCEFEPEGWALMKRIGKGRDQATACIYSRK
jgi:16S rRNA (guanine966-N2)-methyltransferase